MNKPRLGRIRCATITTRDALGSSGRYAAALDYAPVEEGRLSTELASAWGADGAGGARFVTLGPRSGADTYLRFVEDPRVAEYRPYSCHGWNALELVVADCDAAAARLARHGFELCGPPADLGFSAGALRAAQLRGDCGEVLYLTQVKRPLEGSELPTARVPVDRLFIAILTGSGPRAGFDHYEARFDNAGTGPFETAVPAIAGFQGMDPEHRYAIGTLALAPEFYLEIDDAPRHVGPRPVATGRLPAGIAMITLDAADAGGERRLPGRAPWPDGDPNGPEAWLDGDPSRPAVRPGGILYGARSCRRTTGAFGEWLEILTD